MQILDILDRFTQSPVLASATIVKENIPCCTGAFISSQDMLKSVMQFGIVSTLMGFWLSVNSRGAMYRPVKFEFQLCFLVT